MEMEHCMAIKAPGIGQTMDLSLLRRGSAAEYSSRDYFYA